MKFLQSAVVLLVIAIVILGLLFFSDKEALQELTETNEKLKTWKDNQEKIVVPGIHEKYKVDLVQAQMREDKLSEANVKKTSELRGMKTLSQKRLDVLRQSKASKEEKLSDALYELQLFIDKEIKWNDLKLNYDQQIVNFKKGKVVFQNKIKDLDVAVAEGLTKLGLATAAIDKYKDSKKRFGFTVFGVRIEFGGAAGYTVNKHGGGLGSTLGIKF